MSQISTRRRLAIGVAVTAVLSVVTACGGSSGASKPSSIAHTSSASAADSKTYTIGLLADLTGIAASADETAVQGAKAGIARAAEQGYHFKLALGDTQSSPSGTLSAAQKLVSQDHALAIISVSALTFGAAPWLTAHGIPVVGSGQDGPEWLKSKNMYAVQGRINPTKVGSVYGDFMKMVGTTNVGTLGYSIAPLSAEAAKAFAVSSQVAGLKAGYVNPKFSFGSTDLQPIAATMKSNGVDGIMLAVQPNTSFALVTALRQLGVNLKAAFLFTGYGGDIKQAGPGALQNAQNVYFVNGYQPVEMKTPATEEFMKSLRSIGEQSEPTFAEYLGYISVDMIQRGLQKAGSDPSHAQLISALAQVHDYDAAGLLGNHKLDLASEVDTAAGPDNCIYVVKLVGSSFQLVQGAEPICGTIVPGRTVSP
jgi:branched-chain amino acid transport system substrate-binding protein